MRPLRDLGRASFANDNRVIDGILGVLAFIPRGLGGLLRTTQRGLLQGYALLMLLLIALMALLILL